MCCVSITARANFDHWLRHKLQSFFPATTKFYCFFPFDHTGRYDQSATLVVQINTNEWMDWVLEHFKKDTDRTTDVAAWHWHREGPALFRSLFQGFDPQGWLFNKGAYC